MNGKILFTGRKDIVEWCKENYSEQGSEWFLEVKNMRKLNERFAQDGYQIGMAHPFYISETVSEVDTKGYDMFDYKGVKAYRMGVHNKITIKNTFEMAMGNNKGVIGFDKRKESMISVPVTMLSGIIGDYATDYSNVRCWK